MASYNPQYAIDKINGAGLVFDQVSYDETAREFMHMGINQAEHDKLIDIYVANMVRIFTPTTYGWLGRILLALHFLGFINLMYRAQRRWLANQVSSL